MTTATIGELHDLPPTIGVEEAGRLLGIGRSLSYRLAAAGEFPVPVIRCGSRYLVPSLALLRALGVDPPT